MNSWACLSSYDERETPFRLVFMKGENTRLQGRLFQYSITVVRCTFVQYVSYRCLMIHMLYIWISKASCRVAIVSQQEFRLFPLVIIWGFNTYAPRNYHNPTPSEQLFESVSGASDNKDIINQCKNSLGNSYKLHFFCKIYDPKILPILWKRLLGKVRNSEVANSNFYAKN